MVGISRNKRLDHAYQILKDGGRDGARIIESTPQHGGLRAKYVQALVDAGEAEWIESGKRARLKEAVDEVCTVDLSRTPILRELLGAERVREQAEPSNADEQPTSFG